MNARDETAHGGDRLGGGSQTCAESAPRDEPSAADEAGDAFARGLVAIGDSLTRGAGAPMLGMRMQSWALWTAEALALPYTCLARDAAQAQDAVAEQLPRLRGPYDLACVYIGVNDVRTPGFDERAYAVALERIVFAAVEQSRMLALVCLPPRIGRPPAPAWAIAAANETIEALAAAAGAVRVDPSPVSGSEYVLADGVHLTARGQARLALAACEALRARGLSPNEREICDTLRPLRASERLRYALGAGAADRLRDERRLLVEGAQRRRAARRSS